MCVDPISHHPDPKYEGLETSRRSPIKQTEDITDRQVENLSKDVAIEDESAQRLEFLLNESKKRCAFKFKPGKALILT